VCSFYLISRLSVEPVTNRVDKDLNCIKGGGACHLREKVLAEAADTYVDPSLHLNSSDHVVVIDSSWLQISERIHLFLVPTYVNLFLGVHRLMVRDSGKPAFR
jgi:hypothetical protein